MFIMQNEPLLIIQDLQQWQLINVPNPSNLAASLKKWLREHLKSYLSQPLNGIQTLEVEYHSPYL